MDQIKNSKKGFLNLTNISLIIKFIFIKILTLYSDYSPLYISIRLSYRHLNQLYLQKNIIIQESKKRR